MKSALKSGATISEMNAVRKHSPRSKAAGSPPPPAGKVVALMISDVPGDDPRSSPRPDRAGPPPTRTRSASSKTRSMCLRPAAAPQDHDDTEARRFRLAGVENMIAHRRPRSRLRPQSPARQASSRSSSAIDRG